MKFFLLALVGILTIFTSVNEKQNESLKEVRSLISPPPFLEHFHFSFSEPMADSLWLRAIQDIDFCEGKINKRDCKNNGWLAAVIDTATNLSPHFYQPYLSGGLALSVIISDISGATMLFDKADLAFPRDSEMGKAGGVHALLEEKDKIKAAKRFKRVADYTDDPKILWFYASAGRLLAEGGEKELALNLLKSLKEGGKTPQWVLKRMEEKINAVK